MTDSWQTIEQAAVSLRLSVRTVNRHISAGKLQSRLTSEGRREVLVRLPDTPAAQRADDGAPFAPAGAAFILGAENASAAQGAATQESPAASSVASGYTPIPGVSV